VSYYPVSSILARGYAFVTACYNDVSADPNPSSLEEQNRYAYNRVFELWGPRDNTRTDNTTCLAAWAWALSRGMDMLERDSAIDASRVVLTGCSRLGKAALIAGAFDERFPVVVPNQTGGGGVPLAKRNYGENITTETRAFTHWYCRAYDKYAGHEDMMPFDQHMLLACIAPRALLVEGFDRAWFDTRGEFLCPTTTTRAQSASDWDTCDATSTTDTQHTTGNGCSTSPTKCSNRQGEQDKCIFN